MKYTLPADKQLRIAISGRSGCGNTTVSRLLSETLGIEMINFTFRSLAEETGLSLADIIERAKTDDSFDKTVDTRQVDMALKTSCVLGSRLAIWMLKEADLKVYLYADDDVRAGRVFKREGGNLDEIKAFTKMRDTQDAARYKRLYDIDTSDYSFCDLIIDTANYTPDLIVGQIIEALVKKGLVSEKAD